MKKFIAATILLSIAGIANSSQIDNSDLHQEPKETPMPRPLSIREKLTNVCTAPETVGLSVALGSHFAKNGLACPLAQEAQNPIAAAVAAALAVKMLRSEHKCVRYAAVVPAIVAPVLVFKK